MQAICLEQRSISRWSASWCALLHVLIHILETGLCVSLFLPFCSSHWETSFLEYAAPPRWFFSAWRDPDPWYFAVVSGGDIYQGSAQLLQLAHIVFIRAPSISNLRHTDVVQCITVEHGRRVGQEKPYLAKDGRVKELGDLPAAAANGRVMLSLDCSYCASMAARHKWLSWKTKFTSWASVLIFIFFLMFN